jgi:hypothetical protein
MSYRQKTRDLVKASPLTLGSRLGRRAIYLGVSVQELAAITGATRKTCYNWLFGGWVIPAYRERVSKVYDILKAAPTRDEALKRAAKAFNVTL